MRRSGVSIWTLIPKSLSNFFNRRETVPSVGIHPDQNPAASPGTHTHQVEKKNIKVCETDAGITLVRPSSYKRKVEVFEAEVGWQLACKHCAIPPLFAAARSIYGGRRYR